MPMAPLECQMFPAKATLALLPWLSLALGFSPPAAAPAPVASASSASALRLSQSINDDVGGFHYDQEPRGASFMSQVSKRDLWERRQRRPVRVGRRRRPPPRASRGAYYSPNGPGPGPGRGGGSGSGGGGVVDVEASSEFDEFKEDVSANLGAMTELLKEMQRSQTVQSTEVQALSMKVANMVERLGVTEAKNRMVNGNPAPGYGAEDRNFGTSLDGEFNQKIKDVIDEFDRVDYNTGYGVGQQGDYRSKIAQLESRINRIDETLQVTEEKLDSQMEYVDRVLDDVADDGSFDGFPPRPPPSEPFPEGGRHPRPPPPPAAAAAEEFPPPPPPPGGPPPQQSFGNGNGDGGGDGPYYDDGTRYYQERNYNDPFNPPPPRQEIPSDQKAQSGGNNSVNERSGGFHYKQGNASFISSFSKASNEDQRRFDPFGRGGRRESVGSAREPLPRGAPPSMRGRYGRMEEPYFYEGGPMMDGPMVDGPMMESPMMDGPMMGGDYYYDGMYEF